MIEHLQVAMRFLFSPEHIALAREFNLTEDEAIGKAVRLWAWALGAVPDGVVTGPDAGYLVLRAMGVSHVPGDVSNVSGDVSRLVRAGLIEMLEDGASIRIRGMSRYGDIARKQEEQRERWRLKARKQREAKRRVLQIVSETSPETSPETSREKKGMSPAQDKTRRVDRLIDRLIDPTSADRPRVKSASNETDAPARTARELDDWLEAASKRRDAWGKSELADPLVAGRARERLAEMLHTHGAERLALAHDLWVHQPGRKLRSRDRFTLEFLSERNVRHWLEAVRPEDIEALRQEAAT